MGNMNKISATKKTPNPTAVKILLLRSKLKQKELSKLTGIKEPHISIALNSSILEQLNNCLTNYVEENGL
jgi:predicted XRE-type DNA-binding protein